MKLFMGDIYDEAFGERSGRRTWPYDPNKYAGHTSYLHSQEHRALEGNALIGIEMVWSMAGEEKTQSKYVRLLPLNSGLNTDRVLLES